MIGRRKTILLLVLAVLAVSCGRKGSNLPDLSKLQLGDYYVALSNGRYVVLYVEDVTEQSFKGHWYVENGGLSQPHYFIATSCRGHRNELWSDSLVVKADAMQGDTLVVDMIIDDSLTLSFLPWHESPVMDIHSTYLYHDPMFEVAMDTNVVYAHGQCYWTTYPEPADRNDFLSIVLEKMSVEDLTLKDSALKMDVYNPIDEELKLHPLLLLIHGGAFSMETSRLWVMTNGQIILLQEVMWSLVSTIVLGSFQLEENNWTGRVIVRYKMPMPLCAIC